MSVGEMPRKARRAKGEGSLYFDSELRIWVGQASAGTNPVTGRRRRVKVTATTKRDASRRLRERIAELERTAGAAIPATVRELVEMWLFREAPKSMSPSTLSSVRSMVSNHILPSLGNMGVGELRAEDFEALLDGKADEGLARSSLIKLRSYLGQAYDAGMRRRLVSWNPARVAVIPQTSGARTGRALTPSEARSLLSLATEHRLGAWVVVALTTALRPGEVSGLTWDSVDLEERRMVVHRSLEWHRKETRLKSTKTNRSRTLAIAESTVKALRRHHDVQAEERRVAGPLWPSEWSQLVFVTQNGTPLHPANARRMVSTMARSAGIEGRVTPYDLRHTATSVLSARGVAPELLADLLGHVDTRMVFRHYRHPITPTIDVAAVHIDDALNA